MLLNDELGGGTGKFYTPFPALFSLPLPNLGHQCHKQRHVSHKNIDSAPHQDVCGYECGSGCGCGCGLWPS